MVTGVGKRISCTVLIIGLLVSLTLIASFTLASPLMPLSRNIAFGTDLVISPEDVPDNIRVHDPLPSENAIALTWYRNHLDSDEKIALYDAMEAAILGRRENVLVPDLSEEETLECYWAVIYDHPEYFWVKKVYVFYKYGGETVKEFGLQYHLEDKDEIENKWRDYEIMADAIIAGTPNPKKPRAVLKQIYEWIGHNTSYADNDRDQDMSSVFDNHESVCAGYVQALQFVSLRAGIPCVRIFGHSIENGGEVGDGNHTWLAMAPNYTIGYYDVTWDDQSHPSSMNCYFDVSQDDIEKTHAFDSDIAPRNNSERDDSAEMIKTAYKISTGEYLTMPETDEDGYWTYDEGLDTMIHHNFDTDHQSYLADRAIIHGVRILQKDFW